MDGQYTEVDLIVRNLKEEDLDRLVQMDRHITGRSRKAWYEGKLKRALSESDVQLSLVAEHQGIPVGAMFCSVHYGEFGLPEPVAILDTVLIHREYSRQGIASLIHSQLVRNLKALGIETLRTELGWDDHNLMAFFASKGFRPVPRLVLESTLGDVSQ